MFPEDRINTIFGNIEQLYAFQSEFVSKLVQCIDWEQPHLSQIGACFTDHVSSCRRETTVDFESSGVVLVSYHRS